MNWPVIILLIVGFYYLTVLFAFVHEMYERKRSLLIDLIPGGWVLRVLFLVPKGLKVLAVELVLIWKDLK